MSAKQVILAAVHAMPDGSTWDDILGKIQILVAHERAEGNRIKAPSASEEDAQSRLTSRLHPATEAAKCALNAELDALAADPNIQEELRRLEEELACTDWDGMEGL